MTEALEIQIEQHKRTIYTLQEHIRRLESQSPAERSAEVDEKFREMISIALDPLISLSQVKIQPHQGPNLTDVEQTELRLAVPGCVLKERIPTSDFDALPPSTILDLFKELIKSAYSDEAPKRYRRKRNDENQKETA